MGKGALSASATAEYPPAAADAAALAALVADWRGDLLGVLPAEVSLLVGDRQAERAGGVDLVLALVVICAGRDCGGAPHDLVRRAAFASELLRLAHDAFARVATLELEGGDHRVLAATVLAGDTCLTRAMEIAIPAGSAVARAISVTSRHMCAIEGRSAALFALAARLGASLADAPPPTVRTLESYGHHLGIAYQIASDHDELVAGAGARRQCHHHACAAQHTLHQIPTPQPLLQELPEFILGPADDAR